MDYISKGDRLIKECVDFQYLLFGICICIPVLIYKMNMNEFVNDKKKHTSSADPVYYCTYISPYFMDTTSTCSLIDSLATLNKNTRLLLLCGCWRRALATGYLYSTYWVQYASVRLFAAGRLVWAARRTRNILFRREFRMIL
jgi:hypothetical protein